LGAGETLIFDTETRLDPAQRLMVGMWRFYRADPHPPSKRYPADPLGVLMEEGFFYPDDLPDTDSDGYRILVEFAASREAATAPGFGARLMVKPLSWWLKRRLYRYGCRHGCAVVGFNLPFDLGRLAKHWGAAEGFYHGGWSLRLWERIDTAGNSRERRYYPRLRMRSIDPRRTMFGWAPLPKKDGVYIPPARFIDLRTLTFALTDRDFTLERACTAFGDPFEKADVEYGVISPELLAYGLDDVAHTTVLYRKLSGRAR
jgi:hypothetical protein